MESCFGKQAKVCWALGVVTCCHQSQLSQESPSKGSVKGQVILQGDATARAASCTLSTSVVCECLIASELSTNTLAVKQEEEKE